MKIRLCPQCQQCSLVSTGAYWTCSSCGLAVTGQALIFDLADRSRHFEEGRIRRKP